MIQLNGKTISLEHFPDGTLLLKEDVKTLLGKEKAKIQWHFENNEELVALFFLTSHLREHGYTDISLFLPYIPNARQDRVKQAEDVFTLKYFATLLNQMQFSKVTVLDAHSNVSLALIDRVECLPPTTFVEQIISELSDKTGEDPILFYPDEGAGKRYSSMIKAPYCFGIKVRDWSSGTITSLELTGQTTDLTGKDVLIVDDICSYGGTFLLAAEKLHERGARSISLFVSHCEESIFKGKLLNCPWISHIYTTNSIFFAKETEQITVFPLSDNQ